MYCVSCMSDDGTRVEADTVLEGNSLCERHARQLIEYRKEVLRETIRQNQDAFQIFGGREDYRP